MTTTETASTDTAVLDAPVAPSGYRAENTDAFTQSTKRTTRRTWDVFLAVSNNIDAFNTQPVRARIEAASEQAAQTFYDTLKNETGMSHGTVLGDRLECTTTLAAIQIIIKHSEFRMLDAVAI